MSERPGNVSRRLKRWRKRDISEQERRKEQKIRRAERVERNRQRKMR